MINRLTHRVLTSRLVTALAQPHSVDRYLRMVNPTWSATDVYARVVAATRHTPRSLTLTLRPNANWAGARAGQYAQFAVEVDGRQRIRCFSLANSADDTGTIEISMRVHEEGTVTPWLAEHARPGLVLRMSQAEGEFVLPAVLPDHVLLISGGSGITPAMSIARTLVARRYPGRITFLHYAPTPTDVIYRHELAAMRAAGGRFAVRFGYTRHPGLGDVDGHFRADHLRDYRRAAAYVCGPAELTAAVSELWAADGIADRLRVEHYGLAPYHRDDAGGELRFTASGVRVPGDGRTLLEQAEAAGLRPDFGCRMGVCHTCVSVKTAGTVRDVRTGVVSAEPGERVQLCVTAPAGDVDIAI